MKVSISVLLLLVSVLIYTTRGYASSDTAAHVVFAGTYGNGDIYVALDNTINEANCSVARFDVSAQNPDAKNILATAYAAMSLGKTVHVVTNGCYNGFPTLDNSRSTGFFIMN